MWTILSVIAVLSLIASFFRGPNAIWGGATIGLITGIIICIVRHNFVSSIVWRGVVVGIVVGLTVELLGVLGKRLSSGR
jgi:hypothetical protein